MQDSRRGSYTLHVSPLSSECLWLSLSAGERAWYGVWINGCVQDSELLIFFCPTTVVF